MNNIPFIGCISLVEANERYVRCVSEFSKANFLDKVYFLRVNKHKKGGRYGCFDSHLKMYKIALDRGVDYALIFEDDFRLNHLNINKTMDRVSKCINKYPDFWKINLHDLGTIVQKETPIKNVYRSQFVYSRSYIISKIAMKTALETGISNNHIDVKQLIEWADKPHYTIKPPLAYDVPAYSYNKYMDHSIILSKIMTHPYSFIAEKLSFNILLMVPACRNIFINSVIDDYYKLEYS